MVGRIITDMTFLRDEGRIFPVGPKLDEHGVMRGKHTTKSHTMLSPSSREEI